MMTNLECLVNAFIYPIFIFPGNPFKPLVKFEKQFIQPARAFINFMWF